MLSYDLQASDQCLDEIQHMSS